MPLFVPGNQNIDPNLVVELSRWMFPIVAILGMTGVVTGILNSYEIFGLPALAPIAWNGVIIIALVARPGSAAAYAISVLLATIVQFVIPLPLLRGRGPGHRRFSLAWRNPHVIRVLRLMIPVTIGLGLINFNLTLDLAVATLVPGGHAVRLPELRLPPVHAAAGPVLGRRLGRALPAHLAPRRPRRHRRLLATTFAAGDADDRLPAAAGGGDLDRARRADHARPLPAREVHGDGHVARRVDARRVLARPGRQRPRAAADRGPSSRCRCRRCRPGSPSATSS